MSVVHWKVSGGQQLGLGLAPPTSPREASIPPKIAELSEWRTLSNSGLGPGAIFTEPQNSLG